MSMFQTEIEGVDITSLKEIHDDRGSILHMLRNDSSNFVKFGECYFSEIYSGKVKAWKKHSKQTQNISVPVGRIKFVIYDQRKLSSTKGKLLVIELGRPDKYNRITIPPELWYGFSCISKTTALLVNCADIPHNPKESEIINVKDSSIPYSWDV